MTPAHFIDVPDPANHAEVLRLLHQLPMAESLLRQNRLDALA
jgi:hypothetical protein